jgi:hypothetical protein
MEQKKRSAKTILAMYLGWDSKDLAECEYQHGRYNKPVYTIGNDYYCIVTDGQQPAQGRNGKATFDWIEKVDSFINGQGCRLFVFKP